MIQHGSNVYDATPILEGSVEWFASIRGKAGRLKFKVVRDGIVNFVEGDKVTLYVNSISRFSGFVMTKERTSEQIISVTAYDQMFYLVKNKATYVFVNKGAKEIQEMRLADGRELYKYVASLIAGAWNYNKNTMLVAGATFPEELGEIRQIVGDTPFIDAGGQELLFPAEHAQQQRCQNRQRRFDHMNEGGHYLITPFCRMILA